MLNVPPTCPPITLRAHGYHCSFLLLSTITTVGATEPASLVPMLTLWTVSRSAPLVVRVTTAQETAPILLPAPPARPARVTGRPSRLVAWLALRVTTLPKRVHRPVRYVPQATPAATLPPLPWPVRPGFTRAPAPRRAQSAPMATTMPSPRRSHVKLVPQVTSAPTRR